MQEHNALKRIVFQSSLVTLIVLPSGILVDGHLIGAPSKHGVEDRSRTYFDQLTISSAMGGPDGIVITLSLDIVVVEGEGRNVLPTDKQGSVMRQGIKVAIDNHGSCWIELGKDVRFLVLFHHYQHPSYLQLAHLGFYITDGHGLSSSTQGLLGKLSTYKDIMFILFFISWLFHLFPYFPPMIPPPSPCPLHRPVPAC